MRYQSGTVGRVLVARFDDGEDFLASLAKLARDEDIRSAVFFLVGGMKKGRMVLGPKGSEMPPDPVWDEVAGNSEMAGVGTIFWSAEGPKAHLHAAVGRGEKVRVGCLRENAETFLVLEAVVMEIKGIEARRELDPAVGLALLKL
jgi:predicted DNA-binding protein with PD1-like motif